jgi:hypothetical protein
MEKVYYLLFFHKYLVPPYRPPLDDNRQKLISSCNLLIILKHPDWPHYCFILQCLGNDRTDTIVFEVMSMAWIIYLPASYGLGERFSELITTEVMEMQLDFTLPCVAISPLK